MSDIATVPVALLAGGLATRLRPITEKIPKALVDVSGRPFIDHQLELLRDNGIRHVVMCVGYLGEMLRDHVRDGSRWGMRVEYAFDGPKLLGTGGAVRTALPMLGETFWVMYGDSYMDIDYRAVLAAFDGSGAQGLMTVIRNDNKWDRSNAVFRDGKLLCYDKRQQTPDMNYVDYGVALLTRRAAERLPQVDVSDLADLYRDMVAAGEMVGYEVTRRFYEIGSQQGLRETQEYLAARQKK